MYRLELTQIIEGYAGMPDRERHLGTIIVTNDETATGRENPMENHRVKFLRSDVQTAITFRVKGHRKTDGPWVLAREVLDKFPAHVLEQLGR